MKNWLTEHDLQSITDAFLYNLDCSSSNVVNSVFDDIGRNVDEVQGLKKLRIERFED